MVNSTKIKIILENWKQAIILGKKEAIEKINKMPDGKSGRIKRIVGSDIVFDLKYYRNLLAFRDQLCLELPHIADIIRSDPNLLDGYTWTRGDYVDLYFSHYEMVVDKIAQAISKT